MRTGFTRDCEFYSNCGSPGTRTKFEQIHNFRENNDIVFPLALKWRNTWNLSFLAFLSKKSHWVHGDPFYAYEG